MARTHPLAGRPAITGQDLRAHTIITSPTPPAETAWFVKRLFGRKTPPEIDVLSFPLTEAVMDAARAGMGVAIMSEWIASSYLTDDAVVVKRFSGRPLRRPWRIAYRRGAATTAKKLRGLLETQAPRVTHHFVAPPRGVRGRAPATSQEYRV
jgi:LysR family transcriptional regulator for metE and metH